MKPAFTITNRIADRLRQIDQARGFLAAAKLSEEWISEMSHDALVREAHATTHIEGSQLKEYEELVSGVDRRTLQRDLKALLQKNILVESGVGPTDPNRAYVLPREGSEL